MADTAAVEDAVAEAETPVAETGTLGDAAAAAGAEVEDAPEGSADAEVRRTRGPADAGRRRRPTDADCTES